MKLLVSTFHTEEKTPKLWVFDSNLNLLNSFGSNFLNIKGLCVYRGKIYAGHKDYKGKCSILIFSKEKYKFVKKIRLPEVFDIHSIKIKDDEIFIVSSGSNNIFVYNLKKITTESSFIKPKRIIFTNFTHSTQIDEIHLNSIFISENGTLYISGFGQKKETKKWVTAQKGFLIKKTQKIEKLISKNIYQPHSVFVEGEDFWFCESGRGAIYNGKNIKIKRKDYTRGLFFEKESGDVFVGTSTQRIYNQINSNKRDASGIHLYKKIKNSFRLNKSYFFQDKFLEIYDIISLN